MAAVAVFVGMLMVFMLDEGASPEFLPSERTALQDAEILKAAEEGNADAQLRIGKNLLLDALSDRNKVTEALQWLQQSAQNGNTEAMVHLGRLYRTGIGALQNFEVSSRWIQRAAAGGNSEGMLELGRLYRDGVGFDHDPTLAYVWFNRAAAAMNMEAAQERDSLARRLTPEELKAAQDLSAAVGQLEAASIVESD